MVMFAVIAASGRLRAVEPSPPDVLDLVVVQNANGTATLEAVVKPALDTVAELHVSGPDGLKFAAGQNGRRYTLKRGEVQRHERFTVPSANTKGAPVKAELRLFTPEGKLWMIVTREAKVDTGRKAAALRRVPVVQTLPDGTRIVEYISENEARARGLPATGKPAPSPVEKAPGAGTSQR